MGANPSAHGFTRHQPLSQLQLPGATSVQAAGSRADHSATPAGPLLVQPFVPAGLDNVGQQPAPLVGQGFFDAPRGPAGLACRPPASSQDEAAAMQGEQGSSWGFLTHFGGHASLSADGLHSQGSSARQDHLQNGMETWSGDTSPSTANAEDVDSSDVSGGPRLSAEGSANALPPASMTTELDPKMRQQAPRSDGAPRRPMNAFLLFSRYRRKEAQLAGGSTVTTAQFSAQLGEEWRSLPEVGIPVRTPRIAIGRATERFERREFWRAQAVQIREDFNRQFPAYRYSRTKKKAKSERGVHLYNHQQQYDYDQSFDASSSSMGSPSTSYTQGAGQGMGGSSHTSMTNTGRVSLSSIASQQNAYPASLWTTRNALVRSDQYGSPQYAPPAQGAVQSNPTASWWNAGSSMQALGGSAGYGSHGQQLQSYSVPPSATSTPITTAASVPNMSTAFGAMTPAHDMAMASGRTSAALHPAAPTTGVGPAHAWMWSSPDPSGAAAAGLRQNDQTHSRVQSQDSIAAHSEGGFTNSSSEAPGAGSGFQPMRFPLMPHVGVRHTSSRSVSDSLVGGNPSAAVSFSAPMPPTLAGTDMAESAEAAETEAHCSSLDPSRTVVMRPAGCIQTQPPRTTTAGNLHHPSAALYAQTLQESQFVAAAAAAGHLSALNFALRQPPGYDAALVVCGPGPAAGLQAQAQAQASLQGFRFPPGVSSAGPSSTVAEAPTLNHGFRSFEENPSPMTQTASLMRLPAGAKEPQQEQQQQQQQHQPGAGNT
ncbi:DNA binding [Tilletia horrida]|nr:DNA binding [Tilletia horrida]